MYATYAERGLRILAFPSNQFGNQEPGSESQIKKFAQSYDAQFDMFSKIDVNGAGAHPLWKWLKDQPNGRGFLGKGRHSVQQHITRRRQRQRRISSKCGAVRCGAVRCGAVDLSASERSGEERRGSERAVCGKTSPK
ncbi:hypothetical protein F2P81_005846 [Scophthalmus maximus]|uniref:Glutathione peroxidase n=1 Tax=Scophthalmus maximus TaxID=52904 RepID=A0A6A4TGG3_SCOMX|nr:hypothetical protein F2P81_005846 [Scophthalmus maximus]